MDFNRTLGNESGPDAELLVPIQWIVGLNALNGLFSIAGTFGNILVLLAILRNSCLRSNPDLYIFSLACADLLVTTIRQPMLIYDISNINNSSSDHTMLYIVLMRISNVGNPAGLTCMLTVTIDRFLAIRHPFKYQRYCTRKRAVLGICFCWTIALLMAVALNNFGMRGKYILWALNVIFLVCTITIYGYVFIVARKKTSRIVTAHSVDEQGLPRPSNRQQQERKAAKTIALVVGVYILFYVPFIVYAISQSDIKGFSFRVGFYLFYSLLLCNSTVNPLIYCLRSSRYRKAFIGIFCQRGT